MFEFVEVTEGIQEPSDQLGTHSDRFLFKFSFFAKNNLLVLHLEVDFEGVVEVLGVEIIT